MPRLPDIPEGRKLHPLLPRVTEAVHAPTCGSQKTEEAIPGAEEAVPAPGRGPADDTGDDGVPQSRRADRAPVGSGGRRMTSKLKIALIILSFGVVIGLGALLSVLADFLMGF